VGHGLADHRRREARQTSTRAATTAFGAGATQEARRRDQCHRQTKAGDPIFVCPLKDNTGKLVIERTLLYDGALWGID
jgi:basic membrane protein A